MERTFTFMKSTCNQTIDVKFRDVSYAVQIGYLGQKKQILNGLSGFFRSTELTAIMGSSGAGKSTLLNILSGFQKGSYTGTVEYLNRGDKQNWNSCKKLSRYIQQTDYLHDFFTLHETMMIASYLKINRNISRKSRQMLIDDILNTLKISHNKETRVDRLSGGEKKRLSIALELIDNPTLMFLDEPTTGLDSVAAAQCITVLKTLAQAGRTIICTIHQPSAALYEMFHNIYLVAGGHCMYHSPPGDTVDYFARQGLQCPKYHNPADYMLEVVSKEYGNYDEQLIAAAKWLAKPNEEECPAKSSDTVQKIPDNSQAMILTSPPTELMRFWMLLQRRAILAHRDHTTYIKLILHFVASMLISLLVQHTGNDASKIIMTSKCFMGGTVGLYFIVMVPATINFSLEVNIIRKERFNNWYQLRTYYLTMLMCRIPMHIIVAFLYSFNIYFMNGQPLELSRFFMFLLIVTLNNIVAESIGLVLGTVFNPVSGMFMACVIWAVSICFSGALIFFSDMNNFMYYISYLNVMRYIFNGVIQSLYGYHRAKLSCSIIYCHFRTPNTILKLLSMTKPMFWLDVTILFGYIVMLHILAYMLLKRRLSKIY